ncbi:MAG: outer membrane protein assembly factor BamD [Candidatus Omnitrophota bacterium]
MKKFFILFILIAFLVSFESTSFAFWIWTPKEKTFVDPKVAPKDTPKEQFDWAMRFFKENDFQRAADEFIRLTQQYKDSDIAPEAQYYAGRSFEELGKYYFAFQNYQKTADNYPYSKRLDELIEREYNIANIFQTKDEPKLMELELSLSLERSVEIYKKVVENSPFGEYADKALYRMADSYRRLFKYNEAMEAYERIINDYPQSKLAPEAKYQLAYTIYEASRDPDYDQENTEEALEKFEKIIETTAIPGIAEEADKVMDRLKNKKAESLLRIAEFYEKRGRHASALYYCNDIVSEYPDTEAAKIAELKAEYLNLKAKK